ncbi:MAG: elongation factor P [Patescibacteria group bacterium]|mgnify:CR=1 FL=1
MSLLDYSEITARKYILVDGEPYEVLENDIFRMQQRKPQNKTKIRNLLSGRIADMTFRQSDKVEEADIDSKKVKYLYAARGEYWFSDADDQSKRFKISEEIFGEKAKFMKPNSTYDAMVFNEKIFGVKLGATVDLKVIESPPGVRGDTARGGGKLVKVETGAMITVPLFVNEGDTVRINTETGEYRERV